jgi:hypothetical protein
MAGVSSATLEAWAVPLVAPSHFDHTYVVSSCGLRWACRGRATGGILLRSRIGNSAIADCLAGQNGMAGIRYLRTGVCHQIANRILHPAGITVVGCGGYALSVSLWGRTGLPPWPELQACYSGGTVAVAGSLAGSGADQKRNFSGSSDVLHASQSDMERILTEFLKLAEGSLRHQLDQSTRRSLRRVQKNYSARQQRLVQALDVGALDPEEYLDRLNALLKAMMAQMRIVLGEEQFFIVFGEAGRHPEVLVDRDTFMDAIKSERATPR